MRLDRELIYALDEQNNLVNVDDVERGLSCNCHCPFCSGELIAKHGNIKIHHFAHSSGDDCSYAYQTSIHLLAKEIIQEGIEFVLPPVIDDDKIKNCFSNLIWSEYLYKLQRVVTADLDEANNLESILRKKIDYFYKAYKFKPDFVECEKKFDDLIPDILLGFKGEKLLVEIYVTHPVDKSKREKIIKSGVSAIEFDLSKIDRKIDKHILQESLSTNENCYWIYNKLMESKTNQAIQIIEGEFYKFIKNKQKEIELCIKKYGGLNKRYKIYILDSFGDYIFNPPCRSKVEKYCNKLGERSKVKNIGGCERCSFFLRFDNGYLYCQRDPNK